MKKSKKSNVIVLFDGNCLMCNGFARFIKDKDLDNAVKIDLLQSTTGLDLVKKYNGPQDNSTIILIVDGVLYDKSDAVLTVFKYLSKPWIYLNVLIWIPSFIRDPIYAVVARVRYKLFSNNEKCNLNHESSNQRDVLPRVTIRTKTQPCQE